MTTGSMDLASQAQIGAVILATLGAVVYLAMRRPVAGLLVWVALFPVQLDTDRTLGFRFAPADIVLAGLLLAFVLRTWRDRTSLPGTDGFFRAASVLLAWLVVASGNTLLSSGTLPQYVLLNKLLGLASLIASYWLVTRSLQTADSAIRALRWYCTIGSLWNIAGLTAFGGWKLAGTFKLLIFAPGWEDRVRGLLVDPNAYGGYLASVTLVQLCLVARPCSDKRPVLGIVNSGILVLGLALADSRSAWLALLCGVAVLVLHLAPAERRRLLGLGVAFGVVAPGLLWLSSQFDPVSSYEHLMRSEALDLRLDLSRAAVDTFVSSPFWGVGLGTFSTMPAARGYIVHSTYLWLLAETGLVGLLLLVHLLVRVYVMGRTALPASNQATRLLGLCGIASLGAWLGLMVGVEALYQRHYWFLFAAVGAAFRAARDPYPRFSSEE